MRRHGGRRSVRGALLIGAALTAWAAICATAMAAPKDIYVLDIGRVLADGTAAPGRIIAIDPQTGAQREIVPQGPGVESLQNPTGITVDKQGFLLVADTDGYNTNYGYPSPQTGTPDPCLTDDTGNPVPKTCGAVIRVNPDPSAGGAATVISRGRLWGNPSSILLPPDGDIYDDGGGPDDQLLVTDLANWNIVAVDPSRNIDDNQTAYYNNYPNTTGSHSGGGIGLRAPWDIARDPRNPSSDPNRDLWVTNVGSPYNPLQGIPGCDDDNDPSNGYETKRGYVAKLHEGVVTDYICDPDFVGPRGIIVDKTGAAFVADPLAANTASSGSEYAAIFTIDGDTSRIAQIGQPLAAPSGLSFNYAGTGILAADEAAFASSSSECNPAAGGCGGLFSLGPEGTDAAPFAQNGSQGHLFRDPIDVAVDRTGAPAALVLPNACGKKDVRCCKKDGLSERACCKKAAHKLCAKPPRVLNSPSFNPAKQTAYQPASQDDPTLVGIPLLRIRGLRPDAKVRLECLTKACPHGAGPISVNGADFADFSYPATTTAEIPHLLQGRFRVIAYSPLRRKADPLYAGRYAEYSFKAGDPRVQEEKAGCLAPGASQVVPHGKKRTTIDCRR